MTWHCCAVHDMPCCRRCTQKSALLFGAVRMDTTQPSCHMVRQAVANHTHYMANPANLVRIHFCIHPIPSTVLPLVVYKSTYSASLIICAFDTTCDPPISMKKTWRCDNQPSHVSTYDKKNLRGLWFSYALLWLQASQYVQWRNF